jgi:hypothetical protein
MTLRLCAFFLVKMEKDDIQKLIRTKSAPVMFETNSGKITSEVWQRFLRVKVIACCLILLSAKNVTLCSSGNRMMVHMD